MRGGIGFDEPAQDGAGGAVGQCRVVGALIDALCGAAIDQDEAGEHRRVRPEHRDADRHGRIAGGGSQECPRAIGFERAEAAACGELRPLPADDPRHGERAILTRREDDEGRLAMVALERPQALATALGGAAGGCRGGKPQAVGAAGLLAGAVGDERVGSAADPLRLPAEIEHRGRAGQIDDGAPERCRVIRAEARPELGRGKRRIVVAGIASQPTQHAARSPPGDPERHHQLAAAAMMADHNPRADRQFPAHDRQPAADP